MSPVVTTEILMTNSRNNISSDWKSVAVEHIDSKGM